MNVLFYRTNVDHKQKLKSVNSLLNNFQKIKRWYLDQEEVDKVLRVEASECITASTIPKMLNNKNLICEELD